MNVSRIIGPDGQFTDIYLSSYRFELELKKFSGDSIGNVLFLLEQAKDPGTLPGNSINHTFLPDFLRINL